MVGYCAAKVVFFAGKRCLSCEQAGVDLAFGQPEGAGLVECPEGHVLGALGEGDELAAVGA